MSDVITAILVWLLRAALMALPSQVVLDMWNVHQPYHVVFVTIAAFSLVYHTMLCTGE